MRRPILLLVILTGLGLVLLPTRSVKMQEGESPSAAQDASTASSQAPSHRGGGPGGGLSEAERVFQGLRIAPVPLNLRGKDITLVGLGSYLVNAGGCVDCHSNPTYAPGGNPFQGQPRRFNTDTYLAGGNAFGPVVRSRNLTPDNNGLPAGLTWAQFLRVMRTGVDLKKLAPATPSADNDLLQVMPWPVLGQQTTRDLRAMYEYLRAIPSRPGFPRQ